MKHQGGTSTEEVETGGWLGRIGRHVGLRVLGRGHVWEMNAKTTHDVIAMTSEEYSDLQHVTTEVERIQQWNANL